MSRLLQALCLHGPQLGLYVGANLLHLLEEVDLQVGEAVVLHRLVVPLLCQVDQHLIGSLKYCSNNTYNDNDNDNDNDKG